MDNAPVLLAREAPFRIGQVEVRPAVLELVGPAGRVKLQPRVMQVLIALARAEGGILTREDLTESCWEGRIVGEDALLRVMSKLRRASEGVGRDGWRLETVTKVGWRLVPAGQDPDAAFAAPAPAPGLPRRALLATGAVALAAAGVGGAGLWVASRRRIPERARVLARRGADALKSGLPEDNQQAQGFLREAVSLAPDYAEAWGALAMAYQGALLFTPPPRQPGVKAQAEAAARRALELDPDQPQAAAALALLAPVWRNWSAAEGLYQRALKLHPGEPAVEHIYARLLTGVGRLREALAHARAAVAGDEFAVWHRHTLGIALWGAGRIEEADQLTQQALTRWPRHYALWFLRLAVFTYSGRADRAVAMAEDLANRPINIPFEDVELHVLEARAMMSRAAADVKAAVDANLAAAERGAGYAENAMGLLASLGLVDQAFAIAGSLYDDAQLVGSGARFSSGRYTAPDRRQTHHLFMPPTAAMRADPRFAELTRRIGLQDYWRASGKRPDS